MTKTNPIKYDGYIEGYYGRLLSFDDRRRILEQLVTLGMTSYFYAPKDDPYHRNRWREKYPAEWLLEWNSFVNYAANMGIKIIVGLAPGLDLNFTAKSDFTIILDKFRQLCGLSSDHNVIPCLMMDDIPPAIADSDGRHDKEGQLHAHLTNRLREELATSLNTEIMVTPRVYADELNTDTPGYLDGFVGELYPETTTFYCGRHIVAHNLDMAKTAICHAGIDIKAIVVWDNIYANDYCPRRLYLGAWKNRSAARIMTNGVMLNPTGMIETDIMLLDIMAAGDDVKAWRSVFNKYGVPDAFFDIAHAFDWPVNPSHPETKLPDHETTIMLSALDELLWRWKSPLAREWYPFLMGMRGDLLMISGEADDLRQAKIMPPYLRQHFQRGKTI